MATRYWLMKSEPEVFSIDDLARVGVTPWEGVRNYQARNFMRDDMKVGDLVLFYHSNAEPPGVAGTARVARAAYPDATALDPRSDYYDPKASPQNPIWMRVDLEFIERFAVPVTLAELKAAEELTGMGVIQRGQRLSVQPVEAAHFRWVRAAGRAKRGAA